MGSLGNLLRYKQKVALKNPRTGKTVKSVWVRVLGDAELKEAFKYCRIASAKLREELRDKNSSVYQDQILSVLKEQTRADHIGLILASKENEFANNAPIVVAREDAPKIEEVAVQPDAPTLEEQERLDAAEEGQNKTYLKAVEEYIQTKLNEVKASLEELSDEKVFELATVEYANIQTLQTFLEELNEQKAFRGTYLDEACTKRGYDDIEEFKNADGRIKTQLINAYNELEMSNDEIKN